MALNETQLQAVRRWVAEGCGLSEMQKRLSAEFAVSMTYMDLRFLVIELGLDVKDKVQQAPKRPAAQDADMDSDLSSEPDAFAGADLAESALNGKGTVRVELDRITKPGSIVSGTVVFSDGTSASWMLDQFGRLALSAGKPGYTPSQKDLQVFQEKLRSALEKRGL